MNPCLIHKAYYWGGICYIKDVNSKNKYINYSRIIFEENHRKLLRNENVYRTCKNKKCIEPSHLYASFPKPILYKKPWYKWRKGERIIRHHLTTEQVIDIHNNPNKPLKYWRGLYGIDEAQAWRIQKELAWKHLWNKEKI